MGDLEIRQLEVNLLRDPSDLDIRQQLLSAYQRTGILRPNDLLDLAALGDAGAILLTGKTPNLQSRSKKFYFRCAWVATLQALQALPPAEIYQNLPPQIQPFPSLIPSMQKNLEYIYDTINAFNVLASQYLAGSISPKQGIVIKFFSSDATASFSELAFVFERLDDAFDAFTRSNLPAQLLQCAAMRQLLQAYAELSRSIFKGTKKHTDLAIQHAAASIDFSHGNPFLQGMVSVPPGWSWASWGDVCGASEYYQRRAGELLSDCRTLIIKQWLPNYTP